MYWLERGLVPRWLISQIYSRMFRVDADTCTACGLCIEQCPTGNIVQDEEGRPVWGRNCLLCLNCEMKCPQDSISSPVTSLLFRPTLIYNVHHGLRDNSGTGTCDPHPRPHRASVDLALGERNTLETRS